MDAVLVDYRLRDGTGLNVVKRLRARRPDVTAILMTAFPETDALVEAVNPYRVDARLTKPFRTRDIVGRVLRLLRRRAGSRGGIPPQPPRRP